MPALVGVARRMPQRTGMDAPRAKLLLLVDDEARSTRMLAKMLREDGFDVELTFDGASAIGRLARPPIPDALLTDFRMATVDGVTVAKYARSLDEHMPILFITGYPQLVAPKVQAIGANVHAKPVDYAALSADVRRRLDDRADAALGRSRLLGGDHDRDE